MVSFLLKSRLGPDGKLEVTVPTGLPETDVEVFVVIQPLSPATPNGALGWSPGFFEATFGAFREEPLLPEPQPIMESREELD